MKVGTTILPVLILHHSLSFPKTTKKYFLGPHFFTQKPWRRPYVALTPLRRQLPPSCRRPRAVALPPPPRRRSLVGCCVVVRRPISSSHAVMRPSLSSTASTAAAGPPGRRNCWGLDPRVHFCLHLGEDWRIFSGVFSVCRFVDSICRTNRAYTCKYYLSNK